LNIDPSVCFIVLTCPEISANSKKELLKAVATLKKLAYWRIEKVTLFEDHRMTKIK